MPVAAAVGAVVVAAGTTAYSAYQGSQDRDAAQNAASKQAKLAEKAAADAQAAQDKTNSDITAAKSSADTLDQANVLRLMQQRMRSSGAFSTYNKGGTLLTGPQGLGTANVPTATKTLLGQ